MAQDEIIRTEAELRRLELSVAMAPLSQGECERLIATVRALWKVLPTAS